MQNNKNTYIIQSRIKKINKKIKKYRIMQLRLVDATGLSKGYISMVLSGKETPSLKVLRRLERALDIK